MKPLLYLVLLATTLIAACRKSSDNAPTTFITYKVNGVPVEIKGDFTLSSHTGVLAGRFDKERNGFQNTFYKINGVGSTKDVIVLYIPTDSLETKTYHLDTALYFVSSQGGADVVHNDTIYTLRRGSDYQRTRITSYSAGLVSGTFTGVMSCYHLATNSYTQATVTEGSFQNVRIVYQ